MSTVYLFDKNENLISIVPDKQIEEHDQKQALNGLITAETRLIYDEVIESATYFGSKDIDDPEIFWLYKINRFKKENGFIFLQGIHTFFDDLQGGVIRDIRIQGKKPGIALGRVLEGTRWTVGNVSANNTSSMNVYYKSNLAAFWNYIKTWGVEFKPRMVFSGNKITGRYIDIYSRISVNNGKLYTYGDKLVTVVAEVFREKIYTSFIGRGKGVKTENGGYGRKLSFEDVEWKKADGKPLDKPLGQDFLLFPEANEMYGYPDGTPRTAVVDFGRIEDPEELLQATYNYGVNACRPQLQLKSSAVETEKAELGEVVTIIRNDIGIRYQTRIFEIKRDFLNNTIKAFSFGDKIVMSSAERIKANNDKVESVINEQDSKINIALSQLTNYYFNEDGYNYELKVDNDYNLPAGYYSFDKPIDGNPTKVIYMGAGKLLIANGKDANGEWEWRTAADGDGIIANTIMTGILQGEDVVLNLDTGTFMIGDAEHPSLLWDGSFLHMNGQGIDLTTNHTINNINSEINDVNNDLNSTNQSINEIQSYLHYENGTLELGESNSPTTLQLTNDKMQFIENGNTVAYISDRKMYITNIEVLESIILGLHKIEKHNNPAYQGTIVRRIF